MKAEIFTGRLALRVRSQKGMNMTPRPAAIHPSIRLLEYSGHWGLARMHLSRSANNTGASPRPVGYTKSCVYSTGEIGN